MTWLLLAAITIAAAGLLMRMVAWVAPAWFANLAAWTLIIVAVGVAAWLIVTGSEPDVQTSEWDTILTWKFLVGTLVVGVLVWVTIPERTPRDRERRRPK